MKFYFNEDKANEIHSNKYNYSLVNYLNVDTKIKIICPEHGVFEQTPYHHINRKQGCNKCKGNKISLTKRFDLKTFINKAHNIHKNKYDYSLVDYVNAHKKVKIICPKHGVFEQTPNNHLYIKNGCPNCGYNTSKPSDKWLKELGVDKIFHEKEIKCDDVKYKVDAYVVNENTVYEYFGYFWHGHPDFYNPNDINPKNKVRFGELYDKTLLRIETIKNSGYKLIFKWGY